jgi:hypothetical protein
MMLKHPVFLFLILFKLYYALLSPKIWNLILIEDILQFFARLLKSREGLHCCRLGMIDKARRNFT